MSWTWECFKYQKMGHFQKKKICPKRKKAAIGTVEGDLSDKDTASVGRVGKIVKVETVRNIEVLANRKALVKVKIFQPRKARSRRESRVWN